MTLRAWVKETGLRNVRKELDVDPSTVHNWVKNRALPRPHHLVRIHKMSKGRVTYAELIENFVKQNGK